MTEDDILQQQMAEIQAANDAAAAEHAEMDAEEAEIARMEAENEAHMDYIDRLVAGEPVEGEDRGGGVSSSWWGGRPAYV